MRLLLAVFSYILVLQATFADALPLNSLIKTKSGLIQGFVDKITNVVNFLGIPYAEPPIGALRFQTAVPVKPWSNVFNATTFGHASVQLPLPPLKEAIFHQGVLLDQSEDSLNLNIWTPNANSKKHAVMLYIHGGMGLTGAGSFPWHNGQNAVSQGDVVYVTINYRLNAFGWIHLSTVAPNDFPNTTNLAISDQLTALKWVYDNIAQFGGDPNKITLIGHSAGAMSVATLLSLPDARPYIRRVILESVPWTMQTPSGYSKDIASAFLGALNLTAETAKAVYNLDVQTILSTTESVMSSNTNFIDGLTPYALTIDGKQFSEASLQALANNPPHGIDIMHGINYDEFHFWTQTRPGFADTTEEQALAYFAQVFEQPQDAYNIFKNALPAGTPPYEIVNRMGTDVLFRAGTWQLVEQLAADGINAYTYQFNYRSNAFNNTLGACHEIISPFTRDNVAIYEQLGSTLPGFGALPTRADKEKLARNMVATWTSFAKTGNPNNKHIPKWAPYDSDNHNVMMFAYNSSGYDIGYDVMQSDPDAVLRNEWRRQLSYWLLSNLENLYDYEYTDFVTTAISDEDCYSC
ncbi:Carboxylesterase [Jimgerdemannia flammicorona]|uniref:Carboxylic ester hydrolase n=1 Tax=Jimgerdemannia flammicorona TaxID=994334 RepID=A0A433R041_9FUNG|nr:Carboxylesterase [Jimgerdemannia flammicorona]